MDGNPLSDFLSLLAQGLLIIALPIVIAAAFQWFRKMSAELKQKLSKEQLSIIEAGVQIAVRAAEPEHRSYFCPLKNSSKRTRSQRSCG